MDVAFIMPSSRRIVSRDPVMLKSKPLGPGFRRGDVKG